MKSNEYEINYQCHSHQSYSQKVFHKTLDTFLEFVLTYTNQEHPSFFPLKCLLGEAQREEGHLHSVDLLLSFFPEDRDNLPFTTKFSSDIYFL